MATKLYVGNLLYEVNDDQLREMFTQFGEVTSAQVIKYRDSGRSKGFGFVEFADEQAAQQAVQAMNGQDHMGRKLVVSEARPPRERSERSFGGGGRGPRRGGYHGGGNRGGYGNGGNYGGGNQGGYGGDMGGNDDMGGDMAA